MVTGSFVERHSVKGPTTLDESFYVGVGPEANASALVRRYVSGRSTKTVSPALTLRTKRTDWSKYLLLARWDNSLRLFGLKDMCRSLLSSPIRIELEDGRSLSGAADVSGVFKAGLVGWRDRVSANE